MEIKRPEPEVIKQFESLSTPTISDALDRFGISGGC